MSGPAFTAKLAWIHVTARACLVLIGLVTVANSAALFHVAKSLRPANPVDANDGLSRQLHELNDRVRAIELRPERARTDHTDNHAEELIVLRQRLDAIEQSLPESAIHADAPALYARVENLESRIAQLRRSSRTPHKPVHPARPPALPHTDPPFAALGVELRGDERFVSVAPRGATSLSQVRLLRIGESEAGWRLDAITSDRAIFRLNDQVRSFTLP